jgi:hypothetical protein
LAFTRRRIARKPPPRPLRRASDNGGNEPANRQI